MQRKVKYVNQFNLQISVERSLNMFPSRQPTNSNKNPTFSLKLSKLIKHASPGPSKSTLTRSTSFNKPKVENGQKRNTIQNKPISLER